MMAYGCQASLEHALPRIERASELMLQRLKDAQPPGPPLTQQDETIRELLGAVAYLYDAVRYLKEGVP